MADFSAIFTSLDSLDLSVAAIAQEVADLKASVDDTADQANVLAVGIRIDAAKAALDAAK